MKIGGFIYATNELLPISNPPFMFDQSPEQLEQYILKKGFSNELEYRKYMKLHKSRLFDSKSYYYYTPSTHPHYKNKPVIKEDLINNIDFNKHVDSINKFYEIENIKEVYNEEKKIKGYLKKKKMFTDQAEILNEITGKGSTSLFDFL